MDLGGRSEGGGEGVRRASTGWEEGRVGKARGKEGETRALFFHSVPLCSPAVSTPTGQLM